MDHEEAWQDLLAQLRGQLPELVQRFLTILSERAIYDSQLISDADLELTAEQTLSLLIDRFTGAGTPETVPDAAEQLGKRRARQGVQLERLIDAVRLDFQVVWGVLRELAGDEHAELLVEKVEGLLVVIEEYVSDVQLSFVREIAILQRDSRLATERYLGTLFNTESLDPALLADIARKVGVEADDSFEVLVVPSSAVEHFHSTFADWQSALGVLSYGFRDSVLLFRVQAQATSEWPKEFALIPSIYFDSVHGLDQIAAAARAVQELRHATQHVDRLTNIQDLWAPAASHYLTDLLPGYFEQFIEPVRELPETERDKLLDTVHAYLRTGSVKLAAGEMHCHRNTIINRLRQFHELTSLNLMLPEEAALAIVLLRIP